MICMDEKKLLKSCIPTRINNAIFSVVNVEPTKYFHTNANFKVTCSFIGAEKPTGVNWSYKGPNDSGSSPITSGSDNFDLALVKDNTEAILTKGPHTTDDNGEYNCEWEFAVNPSLKPTGTQNVIVARKFQ